MSEEDWGYTWEVAKKCSPNVLIEETNLKVLTLWYWVPTRSAKVTLVVSLFCFHNCGKEGSFLHIWWTCPQDQSFWAEDFDYLLVMFQVQVPLAPEGVLL